MPFNFRITSKSNTSRARAGTISTPHGDVQTPAFVTVGTKGTVKSLAPSDLEQTGTQFIFGNTYHLVLSPGMDVVAKHGGIHKMSGINKPMITDSGGFQVFSLGNGHSGSGSPGVGDEKPALVKITPDGVIFRSHTDGTKYTFTPEFSIQAQQKIGADFMVAFDECVASGATRKYTEKATNLTHEWAERSLAAAASTSKVQKLYGVVQGGAFEDLRQGSARFIAELPVFGIALGGVSVGETQAEMHEQISWMMDVLHEDPRPRHLLGVSSFDDILFAVKQGLDTFDCVLPTRDARIGRLYMSHTRSATPGVVDITKSPFKNRVEPIDPTTLGDVTYAYLHHLFKQRELLAYRLATIHNLIIMERFFKKIRADISAGLM